MTTEVQLLEHIWNQPLQRKVKAGTIKSKTMYLFNAEVRVNVWGVTQNPTAWSRRLQRLLYHYLKCSLDSAVIFRNKYCITIFVI